MVHLNAGGLPLNRYLVEIAIPDEVWPAVRREEAGRLPVGRDAVQPNRHRAGGGMADRGRLGGDAGAFGGGPGGVQRADQPGASGEGGGAEGAEVGLGR